MAQEATARVLKLAPKHPGRIPFLDTEVEADFRHRIYLAGFEYLAGIEGKRAQGVKVNDGRLARMLTPLTPAASAIESSRNRHLGPGETVELWEGQTRNKYHLVAGDTSYFKYRGSWDAFLPILGELRQIGLGKQQVWEAIYDLFDVNYGVMACCCKEFDRVPHTLCVIRDPTIDMKNVGKLSFPAGAVQAFESIPQAMERILYYEGLVSLATWYNGLVKYDFPNCQSMTFGSLCEAKYMEQDGLSQDALARLGAMTYFWAEQSTVASLIAGDTEPMKQRLDSQGLTLPPQPDGSTKMELAEDAALTFSTFQSLGLL